MFVLQDLLDIPTCPPAGFNSVKPFDLLDYIDGPWYVQRQVRHSVTLKIFESPCFQNPQGRKTVRWLGKLCKVEVLHRQVLAKHRASAE